MGPRFVSRVTGPEEEDLVIGPRFVSRVMDLLFAYLAVEVR